MLDTGIPSLFPPCVRKIGIIAPSKLPDRDVIEETLALFQAWGVETVCSRKCFSAGEEDYFSSDEKSRADDFNRMLHDADVDLIYCARGGYGAGYILDLIDWDLLRKRNLPVLGYSDITALHLAMTAHHAGRPVAIKMLQEMGRVLTNARTMDCMRHTLNVVFGVECPRMQVALQPLSGSCNQGVHGGIMPENLMVLASLCGSRHLPDWSDKVLAVEDIDEEPRKIDRALLQLDLCGVFDSVRAVVFADFTGECGTEDERKRVFKRFAGRHPQTPFFYGLNFGHGNPSLSFAVNSPVDILNNTLYF